MPPKKEKIKEAETSYSDYSDSVISPAVTKQKSKMSDKVTLSFLTKFIKPYKGDRESLPAFLTNCENAISLASTDQQGILCKFILSQLEDKAQLACCLKKFSTWPEIKTFLKSTFGEKKHSTHLLVDLQNCKQMPSEDVMQYSLRIETCLTRMQSDIHYSCDNKDELVGRLAASEDLARDTFLLGINSNISTIVRSSHPKTLSEAISKAIEEEKIYNLSKLGNRTFKQCSICHKNGHNASDCFKNKLKHTTSSYHTVNFNSRFPKNNNQNGSDNSQNNLNSNTYQRKFMSNYNPNKICAYCKNQGHLLNECRRLKFKNNNMRSGTRLDQRNYTQVQSSNPSNVHVVDNNNETNLN